MELFCCPPPLQPPRPHLPTLGPQDSIPTGLGCEATPSHHFPFPKRPPLVTRPVASRSGSPACWGGSFPRGSLRSSQPSAGRGSLREAVGARSSKGPEPNGNGSKEAPAVPGEPAPICTPTEEPAASRLDSRPAIVHFTVDVSRANSGAASRAVLRFRLGENSGKRSGCGAQGSFTGFAEGKGSGWGRQTEELGSGRREGVGALSSILTSAVGSGDPSEAANVVRAPVKDYETCRGGFLINPSFSASRKEGGGPT